jgi:hypothetical protein
MENQNTEDLKKIYIPWKKTEGVKLPINKSCLCLRKGNRICNLYFDGVNWKDDGYDSKDTRIFIDVTHYVTMDSFEFPN